MTEAMSYHRRMLDESPQERRGSANSMRRDSSSTATLLTREQQLREEIARLKREEQELREKDDWVKQTIYAVREKIAAERRPY